MANESKAAAAASSEQGSAGAPAEPTPEFTLTLDRSRPFGEVHGESIHGFEQDGIPFDKGGRLMLQAITDPKERKRAEEVVRRKLARLKAAHVEAVKTPVEDTSNMQSQAQQIEEDPDSDINLGLWARGKLAVMPHVVYRTMRKRFSKHFSTLAEVKAYLVKEKVVDQSELAA